MKLIKVTLVNIALVTALFFSTSAFSADNGVSVFFKPRSDTEYLLLIRYIPVGISYKELRSKMPDIGELKRPYKRSREWRTMTRVTIFGKDADLKFKFNGDTMLYAYSYEFSVLPQKESELFYKRLYDFYVNSYGDRADSQVDDLHGHSEGFHWYLNNFELAVGINSISTETPSSKVMIQYQISQK